MKKSTVQIVRELVSKMVFPFKIKSVTDNLDGTYLLVTGSTHYLQKGDNAPLVISGNNYEILEVVINTSVKVKGSVIPIAQTFNLPLPKFFHGTIKQTNEELSDGSTGIDMTDMANKCPMVYLLRPFIQDVDAQDLNDVPIEREAPLTIFFLTVADFTWRTDEFDHDALEPMWNMLNTFIEACKASLLLDKLGVYQVEEKIKFAIYNANGADRILFKDNLSGYQLNITLPILAQCCDIDC